MRRKILRVVLCALTVPCLCSCTTVLPEEMGGSGEWVVSKQSSYFEDYVSETSDESCSVKGNVYLFAEDAGVCRFTSAKESEIDLQGSVRNVKGDVRLVCEATDGVQTILVEGEDHKIEKTVMVSEGEGEIYFTGEGSCEFKLEMKAGMDVTFGNGTESESTETDEDPMLSEDIDEIPEGLSELPESPKSLRIDSELPEGIEGEGDAGFPGVTDEWPESISLENKGMSANPLYIDFKVDEAMKVSVSCVTTEGTLRVMIIDQDKNRVYFDEKDPRGDYEISIDEIGTSCLVIYADAHRGSIKMTPVKG